MTHQTTTEALALIAEFAPMLEAGTIDDIKHHIRLLSEAATTVAAEFVLLGPIEHAEKAIREAGGDPEQIGKDGAALAQSLMVAQLKEGRDDQRVGGFSFSGPQAAVINEQAHEIGDLEDKLKAQAAEYEGQIHLTPEEVARVKHGPSIAVAQMLLQRQGELSDAQARISFLEAQRERATKPRPVLAKGMQRPQIMDTELHDVAEADDAHADLYELLAYALSLEEAHTRPGSDRYMADDGDGEREEFGTLAEAHEWADEQVTQYRLAAMADGEWQDEVNDVAVWRVIATTREFQDTGGSDFVLESTGPAHLLDCDLLRIALQDQVIELGGTPTTDYTHIEAANALLTAAESEVEQLKAKIAAYVIISEEAVSLKDEFQINLSAAQDEIAGIVEACGFEHDSDPEAPRTLVGYVRETQSMAVNHAEHVTEGDTVAAVRRLSSSSRHVRAQLDDATKPLPFKDAPKDRAIWAIVPMSWCARRETFQDRENDPWDDVLGDPCPPDSFFAGWVPAGAVKA